MSTWGQDILNPEFTFGDWLPQANDPQFDDFQAYLDYLAQLHDAADWNQPAFAAPTTFTTPDGQQMSAAGYHGDLSAGEYAASHLNNKFMKQGSRAIDRLGMMSYLGLHPDEAQMALNAFSIDPQTGLPVQLMDDSLYALIERELGITPQLPTLPTPVNDGTVPGSGGKTPAEIAAEQAATAKAATLAAHMHNGHPDPGWMIDPNDPTNIIPVPGSGSDRTGIFADDGNGSDAPVQGGGQNPATPDMPSDIAPGWLDILGPGGQLPAGGHPKTPPADTPYVPVADAAGQSTPTDQLLTTYAGAPDQFSHLPAIVANYFRKRQQPIMPMYGYQQG